jgi:transposase
MTWYPVGVYLHQRGVQVYRVSGQKTRDLRRVFKRHVSSDRIDSRVLAALYQVACDTLVPWRPATGDQLALQRGCREYNRWRQQDIAIQNRLQSYDHWAWGGLHKVVPVEAQPWMRRHWYDPWQVCAAGVEFLTKAWQAASPSRPADVPWIPRWVVRARQMSCLFGSPEMVGYAHLQDTVSRQLDLLLWVHQQQDQLKRTLIQPLYEQLYPDRLLETIPGVGMVSAATYIAFIQDIERFATIQQFRKWAGMVPSSGQSGEHEAKGLPLTKAGPNLIKATLYLNAQVARLHDVQLAALYYRQMVDYGKHYHQAICACASHLASRIYAVLKQHRPYQLRGLDGLQIDKKSAHLLCRTRFRVPEEVRQRQNRQHRKARREARLEKQFHRRSQRAQ